MKNRYAVASVSWPDCLVFGEGDGKLDSIDSLRRRVEAWCSKGTRTLHWREVRTRSRFSRYYSSGENPRTQERKIASIAWDDFEAVPAVAHEFGVSAQLYISILDDGRPLADASERARSFHNSMHGQHVTWQTDWSRDNPRFTVENRDGSIRQWGVPCYGYPEVREHMLRRIETLVDGYGFDGIFLCLRSQCKPAEFADQFGFNDPVCRDYAAAYGGDIRREDFDMPLWRNLLGSYFTQFLRELRKELRKRNLTLGIGVPRGEIIGPPLGNWTLEWRRWIGESLLDEIVIDQDSSRCPSMWHDLWPMHRGYGYLQNYIDGRGLKTLEEDIVETYTPVVVESGTKLYVARQWHPPDDERETQLLSLPGVSGLVFSAFRHDNPEAVRRGDFRA